MSGSQKSPRSGITRRGRLGRRNGTRLSRAGSVSAETPGDDGPIEALIPTTDGPALVDLLKMSEAEWEAYTRGSAMRRAGYAGLRRNVAIALGNRLSTTEAPDPDVVGELVASLSDEDETVATAAAWGLGRVVRG